MVVEGTQNICNRIAKDGCLFLSLVSIAEEYTGKHFDIIDAYLRFVEKGYMDKSCYCLAQSSMLEELTGKHWTRMVCDTLPVVTDNMYTVVKYVYNDMTHFRRRGWDVYANSQTVTKGRIAAYYCYTVEG